MWVRQKQDGKAPPEVCRWLMQVLASHELSRVVLATEEALLQLLAEPLQVQEEVGPVGISLLTPSVALNSDLFCCMIQY